MGGSSSLREEARAWLEKNLSGPFAGARGLGGPGREHEGFELRHAWERHLGKHGWTCPAWPERHGGRAASLEDQVACYEEYARADAPARVGHIGEGLIGPTILEFGTDEQKDRFLPAIQRGDEPWRRATSPRRRRCSRCSTRRWRRTGGWTCWSTTPDSAARRRSPCTRSWRR
ncbi:acyl-CoA dehydrogenase family protein [Nonomuraea fastidiosa]